MANAATPITKFRISEDNLKADPNIKQAYERYFEKRHDFGEARRNLTAAIRDIHQLLDKPLRSNGSVPDGKEWTLTEDDERGLVISVWSEPRQRGRAKPKVPTQTISFNGGKTLSLKSRDA